MRETSSETQYEAKLVTEDCELLCEAAGWSTPLMPPGTVHIACSPEKKIRQLMRLSLQRLLTFVAAYHKCYSQPNTIGDLALGGT